MVNFSILFAVTSLLATTSVAQAIYDQDVCVSTYAGNYNNGNDGYRNGPKDQALFSSTFGLAFDSVGNLYVGDSDNYRIRKVDTNGNVSTLVGTGKDTSVDGPLSKADVAIPSAMFVDAYNNLIFCDYNLVRNISNGVVTTFAGNLVDQSNYKDGQGKSADLSCRGLAMYRGNLYIGDGANNVIREINATDYVSTYAGRYLTDQFNNTWGGYYNGNKNTDAIFNFPTSVAIDSKGRIFVVDEINNVIRMIYKNNVSTFAGVYQVDKQGNPVGGYRDGPGDQALFSSLYGITIDAQDNLYVSDGYLIRKITPSGYVTTLAGTYKVDNKGKPIGGYKDGSGKDAQFVGPLGMTLYKNNLYVGDDHIVRKITFSKCQN